MEENVAANIAGPVYMIEREIPAGPFSLTAFERMHERNAPADIYIEGDGKAWLSRTEISLNPTPHNPVALRLASRDKAENVAYLARPCQYSGMLDKNKACDEAYWTNKRFAPEVLKAYNDALDEMKRHYGIQGYNLIGFSGGGAVAAILAAQREDVLSLRTVAGNLDHRAHSAYHNVAVLEGSLNPPDFAPRLRAMPQVHFIGGQDPIMPPAILESYLQALGPTNCVQYKMIQEAEHDKGWADKWPELLSIRPTCDGDIKRMDVTVTSSVPSFSPTPLITAPTSIETSPEKPEKP